jgi:hypothetical protein
LAPRFTSPYQRLKKAANELSHDNVSVIRDGGIEAAAIGGGGIPNAVSDRGVTGERQIFRPAIEAG